MNTKDHNCDKIREFDSEVEYNINTKYQQFLSNM